MPNEPAHTKVKEHWLVYTGCESSLLFLQIQGPFAVNQLFWLPLRRNASVRMIFCHTGEFCVA